MYVYFFQKFWHIVSDDVILFVRRVLNEGLDITVINQTHIALILKIDDSSVMSHFRPISLVMSFIRLSS